MGILAKDVNEVTEVLTRIVKLNLVYKYWENGDPPDYPVTEKHIEGTNERYRFQLIKYCYNQTEISLYLQDESSLIYSCKYEFSKNRSEYLWLERYFGNLYSWIKETKRQKDQKEAQLKMAETEAKRKSFFDL